MSTHGPGGTNRWNNRDGEDPQDGLRRSQEFLDYWGRESAGEPAPCQSTYRGSVCDLPDGHGLEHSCWIEGWGDLVWTDEQSEADYQRVVDFWRERGVTYPPVYP